MSEVHRERANHREYPSLKWIHRARERHYDDEKDKALSDLQPTLSPRAAEIAKRLGLRAVRASGLAAGRRRIA